ncbi:hypothetical protein [Bifidobacterium simiiventris]|uniref:hypothetical protein n=1 Tax=Bifidobacterium simiiventris TaxID=2834434 RepID=UPI001C591236|nr:hypothetical protein [Bifidobacterium simiiventris]MBW3077683.1 hypothetical protein [Bifidobacterium simiiventris]
MTTDMERIIREAEQRAQTIPMPTDDATVPHGYRPGGMSGYFVNEERRRRLDCRRAAEANRPTGTELNQTTRKLGQQQSDLSDLLAELFDIRVFTASADGYELAADTWTTLCMVDAITPSGRSTGSFQATGGTLMQTTDTSVAGYRLRLVVDGAVIATADAVGDDIETGGTTTTPDTGDGSTDTGSGSGNGDGSDGDGSTDPDPGPPVALIRWEGLCSGTITRTNLNPTTRIELQAHSTDAWPADESNTASLTVQVSYTKPDTGKEGA